MNIIDMAGSFLQPQWKNRGLLTNRFQEVRTYIKDKRVLDVGCAVGYSKPNWLHELIQNEAKSIRGLDIDKVAVHAIAGKGFNVICADAQNFRLDELYDVIHAGELIEHLDNFHGFLQCCKEHLDTDGILVLTTPNAMRAGNFIYSYFGQLRVNKEHTCWFCDKTITSLLQRNGYNVKRIDYIKHDSYGLVRKAIATVLRFILPPRMAWNTMLVVAQVQHIK